MVIYSLQKKNQSKRNIITDYLKGLAEILSTSYDKLKSLALKASLRKAQLLLYNLASQTYKNYMELVAQIQLLENKVLQPLKEEYSGEWHIIPFNSVSKPDNTEEIFDQCKALKQDIQHAYTELLKNNLIPEEQKKLLEYQLTGLLASFLKLTSYE